MPTRSTPSPRRPIHGVVLCRVGQTRLAVAAEQVASFGLLADRPADLIWIHEPSGPVEGRVLWTTDEATPGVVVDDIAICPEEVELLSSPAVLARAVGGALEGFVVARDRLWPLVSLPALARFLAASRAGGGP